MFSFFKKKAPIDDGIPLDLDDTPVDNRPPPLPDSQCSWLDDPDDYSELPTMPSGTMLSMRAGEEFIRKQELRAEAVVEVDRKIKEDKILYRWEVTPEQREVLINQMCRMYQESRDLADLQESNDSWERRRNEEIEERRHQELLDSLENLESSTAYGAAKKFQKEHPFIAGWVGADIAHKIKKGL